MEFFIGFAIGMAYGCFLWWQTLLQDEELYQEHLRLQRELMMTRRQLYATDRTRGHRWPHSSDRPNTDPSMN
jgi:hypothetical protein